MQLFQFKKNLRNKPIKNNYGFDGSEFSDKELEPYSPKVSEYVPSSFNEKRNSTCSPNVGQNEQDFLEKHLEVKFTNK